MAADPEKARIADAIEIAAWKDVYTAAPIGIVHALGLEVVRVADACCFVARTLPVSLFNRCLGLGNERPAKEGDVDDVLRALHPRAGWVQHGPASRTPEIAKWLEQRGFRATPRSWAKFLRGTEPVERPDTPFTVREVTKSQAHEFATLLADAHGMPSRLAEWTAPLVGRAGWHGFAAFDGERMVAGGMSFVQGERAWLGLGGTIAAYREKRAQAALLAERTSHAIAAGAKVLAIEAGETPSGERSTSYANVVLAGFRQVASRTNYERI